MAMATESFLFLNYHPNFNPSSFPSRRLRRLGPPSRLPLSLQAPPSLQFCLGFGSFDRRRRRPFVFSPAAAVPHDEESVRPAKAPSSHLLPFCFELSVCFSCVHPPWQACLCCARSVDSTISVVGDVPRYVIGRLANFRERMLYGGVNVDEEEDDLKREAKESEEAWKQTLAAFKEQALKMQTVSQEAYEIYSNKAKVILKDTSEKLKIQAEKARYDLSIVAEELSKDGKEYLSTAAENSPDSIKDVVEAFSSPSDNLNDISNVRDFYLGIPYGLLLSVGGFMSFMLTGSTSAIQFGVILGGTLFALAVISLRSYKSGKPSPVALKGQAAIAGIIFLREIRLLLQRPSFASCLTTLISVSMVVFYLYHIKQKAAEQRNGPTDLPGSET